MILSIWRYCHLSLAIISSVFLIVAAITGIVLAFDPVHSKQTKFSEKNLDNVTISNFIGNLNERNSEILEISVDHNSYLQVKSIDLNGKNQHFFASAIDGSNIGNTNKKSHIYNLFKNIHRSLLLKKTGRLIIGVISFILFLMSITGSVLVIKRQLSIKKFYSKIIFDDFYQFWHTITTRYLLLVIIIISISGIYLSLQTFDYIPISQKINHNINYDIIKESEPISPIEIPIFKETKLSEISSVQFPFSPFKEDQYKLIMKEKELIINQYDGSILSSVDFSYLTMLSKTNYQLHTGSSSSIWAIILAITCVGILFFIFSGFKITLKRIKFKKKNKFNSSESSYLILVGSENGNTNRYAENIYDTIVSNGKKVFIDQLNNYKPIKNLKQLIVVTSTYGLGQPPSNAKKFIEKFTKKPINTPFEFSVLGFGSRSYPDFCQFAIDVNEILENTLNATAKVPLKLINNQSKEDFKEWMENWTKANELTKTDFTAEEKNSFEIVSRTYSKKDPNKNFTLELKPERKLVFQSGDLIAIKPPEMDEERYYSIAKNFNNNIFLSLRRHEKGVCSIYLDELKTKTKIKARIVNNINFHIPEKFDKLILFSNGTGIAPLLGMAYENHERKPVDLYWGAKYPESFNLFRDVVNELIDDERLNEIHTAYSKSEKESKKYVQDLIIENKSEIINNITNQTCIMICGSVDMGNEVMKNLNDILIESGKIGLAHYIDNDQVKVDTY